MAIKYRDQVAKILAGTSITITPADNESLRIKRIGYSGFTADGTAVVTIDRVKVGYHVIRAQGVTMFPASLEQSAEISPYMNPLINDIDLTYPVANGESINITASVSGNIFVIYDIYDKDDVKNTEPNGTGSPILNYLAYMTNAAAITTATTEGYTLLTQINNPNDFPKFPVSPVPSNQEFDVHAVGCLAISRGNGTANQGYTKHLRFKYNREVLFDDNGAGFLVQGDSAQTANAYSVANPINQLPYFQKYQNYVKRFEAPLNFTQGDELDIEVSTVAGAAGTIEAGKLLVWLLMTQRRL